MQNPSEIAAFQALVYLVVRKVPRGRVSSYGQVGAMIPPPPGVEPPHFKRIRPQWVGRAMRNAPDEVPWHRVINSQGRISLPAGSRARAIQRKRLEAEGVEFDRNGAVDLNRFGWEGPDAAWVKDNKLLPAPRLGTSGPTQLSFFAPGEDSSR